MFLTIASVLTPEDVQRVKEKAEGLAWEDGARTAGGLARKIKHNLQADLRSKPGEALHAFLLEAILRHPVLKAAARPKRVSRLLLSKTTEGGHYGRHVDNALMSADGGQMRTDLSFTLFLTDPATYEGGVLAMHGAGGIHEARPPAGDLVLYPSGAIHEVTPVTQGMRLACIGWIESLVPDPSARETLFELESLRAAIGHKLAEGDEAHLALDKVISSLTRRWSKP